MYFSPYTEMLSCARMKQESLGTWRQLFQCQKNKNDHSLHM
ncbi:hypothetical protein B4110_3385 [Parageobacillus toebii]|uniref:Uncharacterized protein n=1 Tax=Parageobacillus toebii TaxID=153151 RepID=A0A150MZE2_9BACL|nr:hypothetical protein B4110_3385 [Parageobacillus toebii]